MKVIMIRGKKNYRWNNVTTELSKFLRKTVNDKNIYKAIGILGTIGTGSFLAFKYIPWNKITDKFEVRFDEVFGENDFNSAAEASI